MKSTTPNSTIRPNPFLLLSPESSSVTAATGRGVGVAVGATVSSGTVVSVGATVVSVVSVGTAVGSVIGVGATVTVGVTLGVGVTVGLVVGVAGFGVGVGVGVAGLGVGVGVGVGVAVGVGVGDGVGDGVGPSANSAYNEQSLAGMVNEYVVSELFGMPEPVHPTKTYPSAGVAITVTESPSGNEPAPDAVPPADLLIVSS